jgi:sugar phosphate isomerase/epimerase
MQRMLDEVGSANIGVVMDPCNYILPQQARRTDEVLFDAFERLGDRIVIAHAKDFSFTSEGAFAKPEPPAGTGMLNYPLFMSLLNRTKPHVNLILEHLKEPQMPQSIAIIHEAAAKAASERRAS